MAFRARVWQKRDFLQQAAPRRDATSSATKQRIAPRAPPPGNAFDAARDQCSSGVGGGIDGVAAAEASSRHVCRRCCIATRCTEHRELTGQRGFTPSRSILVRRNIAATLVRQKTPTRDQRGTPARDGFAVRKRRSIVPPPKSGRRRPISGAARNEASSCAACWAHHYTARARRPTSH